MKISLALLRRIRFRLPMLHQYILRHFFTAFFICLIAGASLFLVFDLFERLGMFIKEGSTFGQAISYLLFKIPFILHLMMPISALIATLLSIGRLSQLSEITAMRACGASLLWIAAPLFGVGLIFSVISFILGETIVPWATRRGDEIYQLDIRKKASSGHYSRANFWYRSEHQFFDVDFYDSREHILSGFTMFELDNNFQLMRTVDASAVDWHTPLTGWTMKDITEVLFEESGKRIASTYDLLPLVTPAKPQDFYDTKLEPQTMSYAELKRYIKKLGEEGVPTTEYEVSRQSKISFPLVNLIGMLIAFPFALFPTRSGTVTKSFVAGISVGFAYHIVHALSSSLGAAELIPIIPAAWAANILVGSIGGYMLAGMEHQ